MKGYNILTSGEKIRYIRTKFNINQQDITGGEITKEFITMLENDKEIITEPVAKILVNKINILCKEKDINFSLTEDYLLEDIVSQAKKVADDYIDYINNLEPFKMRNIHDTLTEIDIFLKKYNTGEKKSLLYIAIGGRFKLSKNYLKAFDYYLKAFESSVDNKITLYSLEMMANCNIYLSKYDDALKDYNTLLGLTTDSKLQYDTKFNIALCYKKLGEFYNSLDLLYDLLESHNDIISSSLSQHVNVYLLIGNCLYETNSFNKSIEIYKGLLKIINDDFKVEQLCILSSLADVYRATKNYVKLDKICTKITNKIDSNIDFLDKYQGYIYLSLAKNINALNKNEISTSLLLKALESYKVGKASLLLEDIDKLIIDLLNIFIQNNDEVNIDYLQNELFELIEKELYPKYNLASLKFIKYYNYAKAQEKIDTIVDFLAL